MTPADAVAAHLAELFDTTAAPDALVTLAPCADGLDHVGCCADPCVALCGALRAAHARARGHAANCVVCIDLDAGDATLCPRSGRPCPAPTTEVR